MRMLRHPHVLYDSAPHGGERRKRKWTGASGQGLPLCACFPKGRGISLCRTGFPRTGRHHFPGRRGEPFVEAVVREVREETGLTVVKRFQTREGGALCRPVLSREPALRNARLLRRGARVLDWAWRAAPSPACERFCGYGARVLDWAWRAAPLPACERFCGYGARV